MPDERNNYESIPIPTYEEATSSRTPSSATFLDHNQLNDEAQLHRLLGVTSQDGGRQFRDSSRRSNYEHPSVGSERSSYDSAITSPEISDDEDEGLRRDMEEMEILEPGAERRAQQRRHMRLPKPFEYLRQTLSYIQLPSLPTGFPTIGELFSRIPPLPFQFKVPWSIVARLFGLFILVSAVYTLMAFGFLKPNRRQFLPESVRSFVQGAIKAEKIEQYLWEVSFDDHIAGTKGDYFLAGQIEQHFLDARLDDVFEENYEVYLNYPRKNGRSVSIVDPPQLRWVAKLEEEVSPEKANQHQASVFHGHSKSGNVTGPLVFANYGSREDFAFLKKSGIDLKGSIVLVRYYGTQGDRALKIKAAEMAGAAGCLIYSDPAEDGSFRGNTYPKGRWRPSDGVQRGGVSLMSWVVGDVLTPGWASIPGERRLSLDESPGLVKIPSLPLAWRDAEVLLKALYGKGNPVRDDWKGGAKDEFEWWTGNSSSSPIVNLENLLDDNPMQPIRNVLGKIQGFETPDKKVYVGNHRDAWCFGAVDPGSGTAIMLELVRIFGELIQHDWRPRRSIIFASWDAEEYNLIGSTEHVEYRIGELRRDGVAYLNVDSAVSGPNFWADASPVFRKPLLRVLRRVNDPRDNDTLWQKWEDNDSKLGGLGAGSDYVAFQDLAGCSSFDFGFTGPTHGFPYHSCYDSFNWMKKYGDPDFSYHVAAAQVWALLILEMADERVLPFDMAYYAEEVQRYVQDLKELTSGHLDVGPLEEAAKAFAINAAKIEAWEREWERIVSVTMLETRDQAWSRVAHNQRMTDFETHLLDLPPPEENRIGGVPGRNQFKHVIFGPQAWSGYEEAYFPAVRDAIDEQDWKGAQVQLDIAAKVLSDAVAKLVE